MASIVKQAGQEPRAKRLQCCVRTHQDLGEAALELEGVRHRLAGRAAHAAGARVVREPAGLRARRCCRAEARLQVVQLAVLHVALQLLQLRLGRPAARQAHLRSSRCSRLCGWLIPRYGSPGWRKALGARCALASRPEGGRHGASSLWLTQRSASLAASRLRQPDATGPGPMASRSSASSARVILL